MLSERGGGELIATGSGGDMGAGSEGSRTGSEGGVTTGLFSLVDSVRGSTEVGAGGVTGSWDTAGVVGAGCTAAV